MNTDKIKRRVENDIQILTLFKADLEATLKKKGVMYKLTIHKHPVPDTTNIDLDMFYDEVAPHLDVHYTMDGNVTHKKFYSEQIKAMKRKQN